MSAFDADERLRLAADVLARYRFELWKYGDSIGFEGLLAASSLLGDDTWGSWTYGALKGWAGRTHRAFREMDNTAPGHALCLVFERTGDDALVEAAAELVEFLRSRGTVDGVFISWQHAPLRPPHGGKPLSAPEAALLPDAGPGIFVDCLHFDPPFLGHFGRLVEDAALVEAAVEQALGYIRLLQDQSGIFWHFFLERTGDRYGYGWGRGQGWALLGLLDLLEYLPDGHAAATELQESALSLARALVGLQREDGGWSAVVGDEASGDESSTAAFAAAGFAQGLAAGLFGEEFLEPARRAWQHTVARVDERGVLADVSAAVWPCTDPTHYAHAPTGFVVPWGQGPLLVAAERVRSLGLDESASGRSSRDPSRSLRR
jgi:unsaturated rhamnogalacturonyl hydrolase